MEKKNMILLTVIAVATLLVAVVGATFAYFSTTITNDFGGDSSSAAGSTSVKSDTVTTDSDVITIAEIDSNAGSFTATEIYPGHMEVAGATVTAKSSSNVSSQMKISYNVTKNTFSANAIKVSLYRSSTKVSVTDDYFNCTKNAVGSGNIMTYYETCDAIPSTFGDLVKSTNLATGTSENLLSTETLNATVAGATYYYYIVVEYPNDTTAAQNDDQTRELAGTIKFEMV